MTIKVLIREEKSITHKTNLSEETEYTSKSKSKPVNKVQFKVLKDICMELDFGCEA